MDWIWRNLELKGSLVNIGQNKFLLELRKERGIVDKSAKLWVIATLISLGVIGIVVLSIVITM